MNACLTSIPVLRHAIYEVDYLPENDRLRYTIHPDARKELLKRSSNSTTSSTPRKKPRACTRESRRRRTPRMLEIKTNPHSESNRGALWSSTTQHESGRPKHAG